MKIALLLPSILASKKYNSRIYAPKELFIGLVNGLHDKGHEVFTYCSSNIKTRAIIKAGNIELEYDGFHSIKDVWEKPHIKDQLSESKKFMEYGLDLVSRAFLDDQKIHFDIIHVYADYYSYYFGGFTKTPVIFTIHDPVFPRDTFEYWRLKKFSNYNHIAISHNQKGQYLKELGLKSTAVIHHGINLSKFRLSAHTDNHMAMIGRFIPEKGFDEGIKISTKLKIPLLIASSSNYEKTSYYTDQIQPFLNSPLISKLEFLGTKERDFVLQKSKVFLFPIKWEEPFGLTMIEAMACGTPVIAYARGSVPEIIKDGITGFIVNPSDDDIRGDFTIKKTGSAGFEEAVKRIYSMTESEYKKMRSNCRKHVEENFSIKKMVDNHEKLYQTIINKRDY